MSLDGHDSPFSYIFIAKSFILYINQSIKKISCIAIIKVILVCKPKFR